MSDPKTLKDIMAKAPQNSHLGSKTIVHSGELDIGEMIEKSGCNDFYSSLEECLGENDRDWRKCQLEVREGSSRKMNFAEKGLSSVLRFRRSLLLLNVILTIPLTQVKALKKCNDHVQKMKDAIQ